MNQSDFFLAVRDGDLETVKAFVKEHPKAILWETQVGTPMLQLAVIHKRLDVAELLLQKGCKPNHSVNGEASPLCLAALENWVEGMALLLEHGAAIDGRDGRNLTPLMSAAGAVARDAVVFLIERGADAELLSPFGFKAEEMPPLTQRPPIADAIRATRLKMAFETSAKNIAKGLGPDVPVPAKLTLRKNSP